MGRLRRNPGTWAVDPAGDEDWETLPGRAVPPAGGVEVVIPVYRGRAETLRAIARVLAAQNTAGLRLTVIDDAAPEPALRAALERLAQRGLFRYLRNPVNRGFVASANLGMRLAGDADVVLLNADTEVYDGWLDRLQSAVDAAPDIATATPLSNAATILSYPHSLRDNRAPLELPPRQLHQLALAAAAPPVDIPTAVGFCMYIRRACLQQVGGFDEASFGRGYGEENDFCMRALAAGWRHVAAADCFVWHHGGRSFGHGRARRIRQALATMQRLHPHYPGLVAGFIRRDPLAAVRETLDLARIRRCGSYRRLLCGRGWNWLGAPQAALRLVATAGGLRLRHDRATPTPNLPALDLRQGFDAAAALLRRLGVEELLWQGGGSPQGHREDLRRLAQAIGAGWVERAATRRSMADERRI